MQPEPILRTRPEVREPPYAKPLEAIDRVLHQDAGGITIARAISVDEPFFQGHYPGNPIFPGVFIIESVHQAVRRLLAANEVWPRLEEIRSARFLSPVRPGDLLECHCRCAPVGEARLEVDARCRTGTVLAAEIKLVYRLGAPDA